MSNLLFFQSQLKFSQPWHPDRYNKIIGDNQCKLGGLVTYSKNGRRLTARLRQNWRFGEKTKTNCSECVPIRSRKPKQKNKNCRKASAVFAVSDDKCL